MRISGFLPVILLCMAFMLPAKMSARHIIGGEIYYECLGPSPTQPNSMRYKFTMKIYRDCDPNSGGAPFDDHASMAIYRGSYDNNEFFQQFATETPKITKIIPDTPRCIAGLNETICVEEGKYEFIRDLPVTTASYFIVYQRCCRNVSIKNLINPGDIGATYMVEINAQSQLMCNSSPVFQNYPPIIICNNFPIEFDHSAIDPDGDQLVYSFCSPWSGGGNITIGPDLYSCIGAVPTPPCAPPYDNVNFIVPTYSPGAPMGGNPVIAINSTTGYITGKPNLLGQFVVGVCVQEFRNGILLSTVKREFQFNVTDCNPQVVANIKEDAILAPKSYYIKSCGANTVKFINKSVQQQNINRFYWGFDLNNGQTFVDSTNWDVVVTFPDTGTYKGHLYLNPGDFCGDTATITVGIFPKINADFSYVYDTCVAGPVDFTDLSTGEGVVNKWDWNMGVAGGVSDQQNPSYLYPIPGDHPVRLVVTDKNKCSDDTTKIVNWFPAPAVIIIRPDSYLGCIPGDIFFDNLSTPIDSTYDIVWDFGDGTTQSGVISPTHVYNSPGTFDVSVAITSPIGCFASKTFNNLIRVEPSPTADFSFAPDTLLSNLNNRIQFTDHSIDAAFWNWQFGAYGTSIERDPDYTFPDTGKVTVRLIVTHMRGCKDSLSKVLDFRPEVRWFMPNAFTPNGDGTNDEFLGKGFLTGVSDFSFSIWNRWGEKVFETNDPNTGWNGRQNNTGALSPLGVYVYLVTFTDTRNGKQEFKGYATLVR